MTAEHITVADAPLTSSEALLWTIERDPHLRSTIVVVSVLDRAPADDRLRARLSAAASAFPRLRQRVDAGRRGLRWVDVGDSFDLDHHLRRYRLPGPGSLREVLDDAGVIAGEAFDPARPLWQAFVVEGVEGGRAALIMKIHHSVTDGVGGMALLPILTDGGVGSAPGAEPPHDTPFPRTPRVQRMLHSAEEAIGHAAMHPAATLSTVPRLARSVSRFVAPSGRALSPVTTGRGLGRHLDTLEYPLTTLVDAAHAVDGTINDAFVAAVIGGLCRYHERHGWSLDQLRVTMPISTRQPGDAPGGNRFTPARFVVPLSIAEPAERMRVLGEITRAWRHEPALPYTDVLAAALAELPSDVTASVFGSMLKGVDFVATNVQGPARRTRIAGAEVVRLYAFAPPSGAALNVALLSHGSTCCVGINSDTDAVSDPEVLRECLAEGFSEVIGVARPGAARSRTEVAAPPGERRPRARLTALDAAFLDMESPTTPMHVGALLLLDGGPLTDEHGDVRIDAIRAEIASRISRCPRMCERVQRVALGAARPVWVDDPTFDISRHVHALELTRPGTRRQLVDLCATLQMRLLERSRPLWEMWIVGGLADGSVGLIYKVHHALVDGVSASESLELLLGNDDATPSTSAGEAPRISVSGMLWGGAVGSVRSTIGIARMVTRGLLQPVGAARAGAQVASALGCARPTAHRSLNRPVGFGRSLAAATFDLAELKAVGRQHDATVNDVVLAIVTRALRVALTEDGVAPARPLQALVPVSLRAEGERGALGNRVTALVVPLPVDVADPVARLSLLASVTSSRKSGPAGPDTAALLHSADYWPAPLVSAAAHLISRQPVVNLVVTNVRGPDTPLQLLGARIREITPIVPLGSNLTVGIAAFSYVGAMVISVYADAESGFDTDDIATSLTSGFGELRDTAARRPRAKATHRRSRPAAHR